MEKRITKHEAIIESLKLWKEIYTKNLEHKPEYALQYELKCPLCHYAQMKSDIRYKTDCGPLYCTQFCPLYLVKDDLTKYKYNTSRASNFLCEASDSPYSRWHEADGKIARKRRAKEFFDILIKLAKKMHIGVKKYESD